MSIPQKLILTGFKQKPKMVLSKKHQKSNFGAILATVPQKLGQQKY